MIAVHSGDLGDIVYCLAGLRAKSIEKQQKIEFILTNGKTREPMTLERANSIGELLMMQPWIQRWRFRRDFSQKVDYNFDHWRNMYRPPDNLAISQARFVEAPDSCVVLPWIQATPVTDIKVLVARSHRYRNHNFPWVEIGKRFKDSAICVGTQGEFEELGFQYGFTKRILADSIGDLAKIVASSELIITNQTLVYALAEGLKKPVILERWGDYPNVDFNREGVITDRDKILERIS